VLEWVIAAIVFGALMLAMIPALAGMKAKPRKAAAGS
jgi:hypothetical protein